MNNLTAIFFNVIIASKENSFSCEIIIAALIAAGVAVLGWIIVAYFNTQLEITKIRIQHRCKMLEQALSTFNKHQRLVKGDDYDINLEKLFNNEYQILNLNIQMYGTPAEAILWNNFAEAIMDWSNNTSNESCRIAAELAYEALANHLINTYRDELNIEKSTFFPLSR